MVELPIVVVISELRFPSQGVAKMTVRIPAVERIAEGNLRRSAISEEVQKRISKEGVDENIGPYLAISRETGAGGGEISRLVGQRLG